VYGTIYQALSVDITSKGDNSNKLKKEIACNKLRYYSLLIVIHCYQDCLYYVLFPFAALICITCQDDTDKAFANYRLLQSLGLTIGFFSGTFLCVAFKLYILMILLVVAIMFYVLAEYKVRQVDGDVFEGQIEVN